MDKYLDQIESVWLAFPPEEVFLSPIDAFWGYQGRQKGRMKNWRIILPEEGGILFDYGDKYPFPGMLCPVIVNNVAIAKRLLLVRLRSLKNPLKWLGAKRDIEEIFRVALKKYQLIPKRYSHAVREIYGVLVKLFPKDEDLIASGCVIMEWENAYRSRIQAFFENMIGQNADRKTISDLLKKSARLEPNVRIKELWLGIRKAFNILWFISPVFRCRVRTFFEMADLEKIKMDDADAYFDKLYAI